jgi:hypothetical protein
MAFNFFFTGGRHPVRLPLIPLTIPRFVVTVAVFMASTPLQMGSVRWSCSGTLCTTRMRSLSKFICNYFRVILCNKLSWLRITSFPDVEVLVNYTRYIPIQTNPTRTAAFVRRQLTERSVPVAEPDTLKGNPHSHDFVPTALVPWSDRLVLLEFNELEQSPSRKSAW